MTEWGSRLRLIAAIIISFAGGFLFHAIVTFNVHSGELRESELETLRQEATASFYEIMRGLFNGTSDPQGQRVSASALRAFNTHRQRLEPRCWLVSVFPQYGIFYGDALFPSGDLFEVGMQKTSEGWVLDSLNHMGTKYFYRDLSDKSGRDKPENSDHKAP